MIGIAAPDLGERERAYVAEAVASGWLSSRGPFVTRFEAAFSSFCGAEYGVACNSGTSALHLCLAALRIGPGDEVIVPACTMIGTINPVRYVGAKPVIVDVRPDTWTIDPAAVAAAATKRTRAVIATHLFGEPADVDALRAAAPGIPIIEDAAEAHGAELRGRRAGSLGDAAAFSFYANKILTTGEGGMVVTSDPAIASRCRSLRDHAFGHDDSRYEHSEVGFSYRMSNLQAAAGLAQAERAAELVAKSRQIGRWYREGLQDCDALELQANGAGASSACWVFAVAVRERSGLERDALRQKLGEADIETRNVFHPLNLQPMFVDVGRAHCPVSERLGKCGLYLPSGPARARAEVETVVAAVRSVAVSVA